MSTSERPPVRLIGQMPRVGIRPIIDGRAGVRTALEAPTLALARAVAELLESHVRHASGEPLECVLADPISGVAEATRAADLFARAGVGLTISVTPGWCYGSETMEMSPQMPHAVYGFNGAERPGAVYLAAVIAAHAQKGLPAFKIYGRDVQEIGDTVIPADVAGQLLRFTRAGLAVATQRGKSYLAIGGMAMGISGSLIEAELFERWLGMRVETVDMSEYVRRLELGLFDQAEYARARQWVRAHCREGLDPNPPDRCHSREQLDRDWETSIKMALISRDLMVGNPVLAEMGYTEESRGHNAIAAGFQGQRQWTDYFPNGDVMEALLCSSFDWGGLRQPYVLATENDALNALSMLWAHLLTGTAQVFCDVRTYWSPGAIEGATGIRPSGEAAGGLIHLMNSGPAALDGTGQQEQGGQPLIRPWWEVHPEEIERCLAATTWHPAVLEVFRGGGFSSQFVTRGGMPATMARLNLVRGLGPVLQIAEGHTIDLPPAIGEVLIRRTNPYRPTTWFVPRLMGRGPFRDVYSVMAAWGSNHCTLSSGHIGADLVTLASMLRIPVALHNLPEEAIFRPAAWESFGTQDPEGADYRACAAYGPLHG